MAKIIKMRAQNSELSFSFLQSSGCFNFMCCCSDPSDPQQRSQNSARQQYLRQISQAVLRVRLPPFLLESLSHYSCSSSISSSRLLLCSAASWVQNMCEGTSTCAILCDAESLSLVCLRISAHNLNDVQQIFLYSRQYLT